MFSHVDLSDQTKLLVSFATSYSGIVLEHIHCLQTIHEPGVYNRVSNCSANHPTRSSGIR